MRRMGLLLLSLVFLSGAQSQVTNYSLSLTSSGKVFYNTGNFPDGFQIWHASQQPLVQSDIVGNPPPSITLSGSGSVSGTTYRMGDVTSDFIIQTDVMFTNASTAEGLYLHFRVVDSLNFYTAKYGPYYGGLLLLNKDTKTGGGQDLQHSYGAPSNPNTWYNLEVRAIGSSLQLYFNHVLQLSAADATISSGYFGLSFGIYGGTNSWFLDNIKIFKSYSMTVTNLQPGQKVELYDQAGTMKALGTVAAGNSTAVLNVSSLSFPFVGFFKVYSSVGTLLLTSTTLNDMWGGDVYNVSSGVSFPTLSISAPSVRLGNSLQISGSFYTPSSTVDLKIVGTSVSYSQVISVATSSNGTFSELFQSSASTIPGNYSVQAVDHTTGRSSPQFAFEIATTPAQPPLTLLCPSSGFAGKTGQPIGVIWTDKMIKSSAYPISGAFRSYKYTIALSSDGGSTWSQLASKQDSALLDENVTITQPITISQPSNSYVVRVTDAYQNSRSAVSPSFSVTSLASNQLQVKFAWDYTFSDRNGEPNGVAADGVSRIYLALSKKNPSTGPSITGVTLQVSDGKNLGTSTLGKVMIASVIDRFSDEANSASSIQVTNNTSRSEYWFWYVSPKDFVGSDPQDSLNASRTVHALLIATYSDGSQESISRDIVISRPPLVFIHGLGGGPGTWGVFPYSTPSGSAVFFLNDPRFVVVRALRMAPQAHFWENAALLLSSPDANPLNPSSFASAIRGMHDYGLAANQVDCVTHSMGGSMVRQAVTYTPSYYRQFNYSQGYIHKFITLDSPHLGSPFADIVDGIISDFNALPLSAFHPILSALKFDVWSVLTTLYDPFGQWIVPCLYQPADGYVINPSGALQDLKITGGVRFPQTSLNSHLISGDIVGGDLSLPIIPPQIEAVISNLNDVVEFFDKAFDMLCLVGSPDLRDFLEQAIGYSKIKTVVTVIDYLANGYTGVSFLAESDVVVGVNSQLSGLGRTAPNSTVINGLNHLMVTSDLEVGNEVNRLLNMSLSGPGAFAAIPSTSVQQIAKVMAKPHLIANSKVLLNDSKITLVSPSPGEQLFCDSTMTCHVVITDTVRLKYVKVYFQHDSYTFAKAFDILFTVQVNASALDTNRVTALAVYDYGDSTLFAEDTVNVFVTPGTPLARFDVTPRVFSLVTGESDRPEYKAVFQNCISDLAKSRGQIHVTLADPSVVQFDPLTNSFAGLSTGQTSAKVSYGGLTDTVYFVVVQGTVTGIGGNGKTLGGVLPTRCELLQNYPNPFNPTTTIRYGLPQQSMVTLTVYNTLGQKIRTLVQNVQNAGYHEAKFDGTNLASGVYFYRIQAGSFVDTKKLLLLR